MTKKRAANSSQPTTPTATLRSRRCSVFFCVTLATILVGVMSATAEATASPPVLWEKCTTGSEAGQCREPRGIVASPSTGHLFVVDDINSRIDELTAWGDFVKAWGWGVRGGDPVLQTCTVESKCHEGIEGSGSGQLHNPNGIGLDSSGDLYVVDRGNQRVQKFNSTGEFLLTFGGGVDKTTNGDICTALSGDTCGAGSVGSADGEFDHWANSSGSYIAVGPEDDVYVGDSERIQVFDTGGHHIRNISLSGELVQGLALDSVANIYVTYEADPEAATFRSKSDVHKLSPSGESLCTAAAVNPRAITTDAFGNLYVASGPSGPNGTGQVTMRKFSSSCKEDPNFTFGFGEDNGFSTNTTGIATNVVTKAGSVALYYDNFWEPTSVVRAFSPPPDKWAPPAVAPSIDSQFVISATSAEAEVRGIISPHFWADTTYYVEYGDEECSKGGCQETPVAQLGAGIVGNPVPSAAVLIGGLLPNTTYHYRFVAESSGGGPVRGQGGQVGVDGSEGTFTTFPLTTAGKTDCPNQAFRTGVAARLADCRAYEMVSPVDKNGGDATTAPFVLTGLQAASADGQRLGYATLRSFGDAEGAHLYSEFLASRGASGWTTQAISPPRNNPAFYPPGGSGQFKAFSDDLCSAWILQDSAYPLVAEAPVTAPNLYRRDFCGEGGYQLLTTLAPPGFDFKEEYPESHYLPNPQGHSTDGSHSVFRANAELTANACATKSEQLYETSAEGPLRLVSILPNGKASCTHSTVGTFHGTDDGFTESSVYHGVSSDGSRVFWTASEEGGAPTGYGAGGNEGSLYVRLNSTRPPGKAGSGCSEAEKACTLAVSGSSKTLFWGADPEGDTAIYTVTEEGERKELYEFDVEGATRHLIAGGVLGVVGTSEDASRIYFVSTQVLSGEQENSYGVKAQVGQANLYFHEAGGGYTFVGGLDSSELFTFSTFNIPSPIAFTPSSHSARVSPNGLHLAFGSAASLTGYNNGDQESGAPDREVFLYDAQAGGGAGHLNCLSCNPSGARPTGRRFSGGSTAWTSALLPGWPGQLNPSRLLSSDGNRLFFESFESLVPGDTNGKEDVYEWERSADAEGCRELGAELFVASAGGCLGLISSGQNRDDSELIDASSDGSDVFFSTSASLLPQDPGLIDIYDAHVNGGFPQPPAPRPSCEGEACQGPPVPPNDPTPASSAFEGAGNVKEAARKKAHKKKHAKKKTHKKAKRANHKRRATR